MDSLELVQKIARECGQHLGRVEYFKSRVEWARAAVLDNSRKPADRNAIAAMILSETLDWHAANPIGDVKASTKTE